MKKNTPSYMSRSFLSLLTSTIISFTYTMNAYTAANVQLGIKCNNPSCDSAPACSPCGRESPSFVDPTCLDGSCNTSSFDTNCYLIEGRRKKHNHESPRILECFIAHDKCPKKSRAYQEFDSIVVFLETISYDGAKSILDRSHTNHGRIDDILSGVSGYANFDAIFPLVYSFDVNAGLEGNIYDINYLNWFINRLNFYLFATNFGEKPVRNVISTITQVDPTTGIPTVALSTQGAGGQCHCSHNKVVDLVCLPEKWRSYTYGKEAIVIFNQLVANTIIAPFVIKFVDILKSQVNTAYNKCNTDANKAVNSGTDSPFTTYDLYHDLLQNALDATKNIAIHNRLIKENYLKNRYFATFASIPYTFTAPPATPPVSPVSSPAIHSKAFMLIPSQSVSLPKIIDYS